VASNVDRYWSQYLASLPPGEEPPAAYVEAGGFGFTEEDARAIAPLVLDGIKTATGCPLWSYEVDGKPIPRVRDLWIVTAGTDKPVCVIETTEVRTIPFDEVTEDYARDGGEDDRSLESWRRMYWKYILSECERIRREPSGDAPLVMERFKVVYREPLYSSSGADASSKPWPARDGAVTDFGAGVRTSPRPAR
jgi:uncharacterized protein YhfF